MVLADCRYAPIEYVRFDLTPDSSRAASPGSEEAERRFATNSVAHGTTPRQGATEGHRRTRTSSRITIQGPQIWSTHDNVPPVPRTDGLRRLQTGCLLDG